MMDTESKNLETKIESTWRALAKQRFIESAEPAETPTAILIFGNGSESQIIATAAAAHFKQHGGAGIIDPVALRTLHPASATDDRSDSLIDFIAQTSANLACELTETAVNASINLVTVCEFQDISSADTLVQFLKDMNYKIVMIGCVGQDDESLAQTTSQVLDHFQSDQRVNEVSLFSESGRILYPSSDTGDLCSSFHEACERYLTSQYSANNELSAGVHPLAPSSPNLKQGCPSDQSLSSDIDWSRYDDEQSQAIEQRIQLQAIIRRCARQERQID